MNRTTSTAVDASAKNTTDADDTASSDGLPTDNVPFEALLEYLKSARGFNFSGYKRPSLMRRVEKRMQFVGLTRFEDYVDYLEVHPGEFSELFNAILINVTSFFRDPSTWDYLVTEVVSRLLASHEKDAPIRLWSAGCASGEEAYSLAIVLAEALGINGFRDRVKIYATDVDDEALNEARQSVYSTRAVAGVPQPLLEKYFEQDGNRYTVHKDLRRSVIFGRHDLLKDAPISRVDLLTCRNTLMYFNAEMQTQIITRFHFALNDGGFLFLGKAEMLSTQANLFTALDMKRRIFAKANRDAGRERTVIGPSGGGGVASANGGLLRMREQAFDTGTVAQVVIERNGNLALANERARQLFRISPRDIGRPLQDLEISYRPVELRSRIEQAYNERRMVDVKSVLWSGADGSEKVYLDVQVIPLAGSGGGFLGVSIVFDDVTRTTQLQHELEDATRELETAYEELQSTNEELETTNEELQSTVEELETTNEELQSTNEELETMNEELQSTNEELQTINEELQNRSAELLDVNAFFTSILASLSGSVIVLDRQLQVQVWNQKSEEFWGLRTQEVEGKHLLTLDIGLPTEELRAPIRACLIDDNGPQSLSVDATNRRGRAMRCNVTCTRLVGSGGETLGVIVLTEEA